MTTLGVYWSEVIRTDVIAMTLPLLTPTTIAQVWGNPALLVKGLQFAIPALLILLCHELGHYLACRRHRVSATLPFFIPLPLALGTLGAFIRIREPLRDKRELFDVGVAGPLAGFVVLLPFLFYGIAHSRPVPIPLPGPGEVADGFLLVPGATLGMRLVTFLFHGTLPAGTMLDLHPTALAAWFGMFVTALNLIPLGQLDGGHILYAALGPTQRRLAPPLWLLLVLLGLTSWMGWLLWGGITLAMGLRHPPVRDEERPLDRVRQVVAVLTLVILILSFTPLPLAELPVRIFPP